MKKMFIFTISLIILLFILSSYIFATDINMNLQYNNSTLNTFNDYSYNNQNTVDNEDYSYNVEEDDDEDNNNNFSSYSDPSSTTTISSVSSVSQNEFGLSQILNIFLIVIGVILVLLGIAIIIRLK